MFKTELGEKESENYLSIWACCRYVAWNMLLRAVIFLPPSIFHILQSQIQPPPHTPMETEASAS